MLESLFARRCALYATFAIVAVAGFAAHPTLAQSLGADVWNLPALKEQARHAEAENALLDAEDDTVRSRIRVKDGIAAELVAGRITLSEATDQFLALNESRPTQMAVIRETYPGDSDREKTARNVISYSLGHVPPHQREATVNRLEAELHSMLASGASR